MAVARKIPRRGNKYEQKTKPRERRERNETPCTPAVEKTKHHSVFNCVYIFIYLHVEKLSAQRLCYSETGLVDEIFFLET